MKIQMMNSDAGDLRTKQHRRYLLGLDRSGDQSPVGSDSDVDVVIEDEKGKNDGFYGLRRA